MNGTNEIKPEERWLPVFGYENYYEVSNLGQVRSTADRHNTFMGRLLKLTVGRKGYLTVNFCVNDKRSTRRVARMVANAFIPNPDNKPEVNHKDGVKSNNCVSNLEWTTSSENSQHAYDTGLQAKPLGELNTQAKLTTNQVIEIRKRYKSENISMQKLGSEYGINLSTTYNIITGKLWKHLQ
jgi:hypothetical protein